MWLGRKEQVPTRFGEVSVTVRGDPSKTPCVTYHDVGLNHKSCFTSLLVCSATQPLLLENMCFYHVDAPGSEEDGNHVPDEMLPMTLDKLAEQVEEVIRYYHLHNCMGIGVGAGGYVLTLHSIKYPQSVFGLILLSPACLRVSWWEWSFGSAILWYLKLRGLDSHVVDHFAQRLVSGRSGDLVHTVKQAVMRISPTGLYHYFHAVLTRPDLTTKLKELKLRRLLLLWGYEALTKKDSYEVNREFVLKDRVGWAEIDHCGVLLTEECPFRVLEEMKCFVRRLQTEGYCLEWRLE